MKSSVELIAHWVNSAHLANSRGDYETAASFAEQSTQAAPNVAEGWFNLAVALRGLGKRDNAVVAARKAAGLTKSANAQNSIGMVLLGVAAYPEAKACFQRAITLSPRDPKGHCNLGMLHALQKRYEPAEACLKRAIDLSPELAIAHANLCGVFNARGDHAAAEACGKKAVELDPGSPQGWANLTDALAALGRHVEAEVASRRATELAPDSAIAWTNRGIALEGLGAYVDADAAFQRAIELDPGAPEAWIGLAKVLSVRGNRGGAEEALRKAVELDPRFEPAWTSLGKFLVKRYRLREAEEACRKAIALAPDSATPRALMAEIHVQRWNYEQADAAYQTASKRDPANHGVLSHRLFMLNYQPTHKPDEVRDVAREFERVVRRGVIPFDTWKVSREADRRLRIGLVCGDFYGHPVGHFLLGPLAFLDQGAFQLLAYSCNAREDEVTQELKRHCSGWTSALGLDGAALARRIHDDAIDLLVDLSGHTEHGRLDVFAWKPAPVQVSWLGYFATTGLETIDWKLGDRWVTPIEEEHHFVERIWRLPDSCFCYFPPSRAPEVAPLPSQTTGHTTFGCFNNLAKLNDEVVELWSRVLQAAPKSTLLLKARQLESDEIAAHVRSRFERAGVGPDRLVLEGSGSYEDYLRAYARVDVALDPFPYAGGATTADALWMGVPVLTLIGDHYIGHQGESLLHAATLSDWIARDKDDYVRKAVTRAADIASLRELREQLRERVAASPLFDAPRFSRNLGSAWRGMWERWCNGA